MNPQISVVVPVYKNAPTLGELYQRIASALKSIGSSYQIIFVNDACPEGSLEVLERLIEIDSRVEVLNLKVNLGQHRAVLSGLRLVMGKCAVILDADLQDPPELIPQLVEKIGKGFSAVFASKGGRYQSGIRLFTSKIFKNLLKMLSGIPSNVGMFMAIDWKMVNYLLSFSEQPPFVLAMIGMSKMPVTTLPFERNQRPMGISSYSSWRRVKLGVQTLTWVLKMKWRSKLRLS